MLSHLIKLYAVCKFSYFRLWYLNSYRESNSKFIVVSLLNEVNFKGVKTLLIKKLLLESVLEALCGSGNQQEVTEVVSLCKT